MPARIAGIQVCRNASGSVHVSLDSSTPYWNDEIARSACTGESLPRTFQEVSKGEKPPHLDCLAQRRKGP
jgi:hypothetical protein